MDGRFIFTKDLSTLSTLTFFLSLLSWERSPFYLKEAFIAYLWHSQTGSITGLVLWVQYSVKSVNIFLVKIRVTWTQALQSRDHQSVTEMATEWLRVDRLDKGAARGRGRMVQDFISTTQKSVKCITYQLFISEIFHSIFSYCSLLHGTETAESKTVDKGGHSCIWRRTKHSFQLKQVTSKKLAMQHQDVVSDAKGTSCLSSAIRRAWVETEEHTHAASEGNPWIITVQQGRWAVSPDWSRGVEWGRWGWWWPADCNEMRSVLVKKEHMGELAIITQKTEANM